MRTILYILILWIFYTIVCYSQATANQPPTIECPSVKSEYIADARELYTRVSWSNPTVSDPDNNIKNIRLVTGKVSGDKFGRGHHSVIFVVTDQEGLTNMCSFSFRVKVIQCRPVNYIRNGRITCAGYIYGMTCWFMCDEGYKLKGNSRTTCQKSGRWSSDKPQCRAVECRSVYDLLNGQRICTGYTYGMTCWFMCDEGYKLKGNSTATCQKSGRWSFDSPQCLDNTTVASDVNTTTTTNTTNNNNNDSIVNNVNTLTIAISVVIFILLVVIVTLVIYFKVIRPSKTETSGASGIANTRDEHVDAHYDNAEVDRGGDALPQDGDHQEYVHYDDADVERGRDSDSQGGDPQISRDTRNTYSDLAQCENPNNIHEYGKLRLYGNTSGAGASVQTSNYQDLRVYGNQGDNHEYGKIQSPL